MDNCYDFSNPNLIENTIKCLWLTFESMAGIFVVMGLIYLVVILLNNVFNNEK